MKQTKESDAVRLLEGHPRDRRVMIAGQYRRLHTELAVGELLAHARTYRSEAPDRARDWASLAWYAATRVPGVAGRELQGVAQAEEGNARRLLGQWGRAEVRFRRACELVARSPESPSTLEVRILSASYYLQRERWVDALDALADAMRLADRHQDADGAYRATLKRGLVQREQQRHEQAVSLFRRAYRMAQDHVQRVGALHNAILTYADGGWYEAALETHEVIRPTYERVPLHLRARGDWVRGRIEMGLGRCEDAADSLGRARSRLTRGSYHWEVAELLCDEAEAYLRLGELERVSQLAGIGEAAYRAMGMERGAQRAASLMTLAARSGVIASILQMRHMLRLHRSGERQA